MNFKRKKPRRQVRCVMCTPRGSMGNSQKEHGRGRNLDRRKPPMQEPDER